jgi:hypothetical protein
VGDCFFLDTLLPELLAVDAGREILFEVFVEELDTRGFWADSALLFEEACLLTLLFS